MEHRLPLAVKGDAQTCFEQAIKEGRLSANPKDKNFAGHYMYMGSSPTTNKDFFKDIITRTYIA